MAFTEGGQLGTAQGQVETFKLLSIATELPRTLTIGDDLDVPISVHNHAPISQTVRVTVTEAPWF